MADNKLNIKSLQVSDKKRLYSFQSQLKTKECNLCHYQCDLRQNYLFPVASNGSGRILVVGPQAFLEEHKNTIAMSGPFRTIFNHYLSRYTGLTENDCTFSYAVKCTSLNKKETVKAKVPEFKNCSRYLKQDIKYVDPVVIVFLSKDAAKGIIDNKRRSQIPMGTPFQYRIMGKMTWCYFMINPIVSKTATAAVPTVEAQFKGLYSFFDTYTNIYDTILRPLLSLDNGDPGRRYILVDTIGKLKAMYKDVKQYTYVGMDTETTGLDVYVDDFKIVGISIAVEEDCGYYIPFGHNVSKGAQLDWETEVKPTIKAITDDPKIQTIWHNLYYDYAACKVQGLDIFKLDPDKHIWTHDSMVMAYLHNENVRLNLKEQMYLHFNIQPKKFKGVLEGSSAETFADVDPMDAIEYATDDAINALMLFKKTAALVYQESKEFTNNLLVEKIYPAEIGVIKVLADAHLRGIRIDIPYLRELQKAVIQDLSEVKSQIFAISTAVTGLGSGPKLISFLESIIDERFLKKITKKYGELTSQEKLLNIIVFQYKNAAKKGQEPGKWEPQKLEKYLKLIVRYKHLLKMKSTYIESVLDEVHEINGIHVIHPRIKSIGTTSGRMSSGK